MATTTIALLALMPLLGCLPKGSRPHDMGEAAHEAEAATHDEEAAAHDSQYDPAARETYSTCGSNGRHRYAGCWTSVTNPTQEHLRAAESERKAATAHREASRALARAEDRACLGISPDDRDMSPFMHVEDIVSVEPHLRTRSGGKDGPNTTIDGATITFLAVPGMTTEWLQRVVDCHVARNAVLGHDLPEMYACPLVPKGAQAQARSTGNGFAVDVWSSRAETGEDILSRARRLVPPASVAQ